MLSIVKKIKEAIDTLAVYYVCFFFLPLLIFLSIACADTEDEPYYE